MRASHREREFMTAAAREDNVAYFKETFLRAV